MRSWVLVLTATMAWAQSVERHGFEVASIKVHKDEGVGPRNSRFTYGSQGIEVQERTLGFVIAEAYGIPVGRIVPGAAGKDEILKTLRQGYDIAARAEGTASKEQLRAMLQALLTERFHLKLHRERKNELVYKLVVAKGGAKLQEGDGGDLVMAGSAEGYTFRNAEVHRLCGYLQSHADRAVVDETGLTGLYSFTVKMPEDLRRAGGGVVKTDGNSPDAASGAVFAEVLRPLGLQLIGGRADVEYMVVDQVGPLTEN